MELSDADSRNLPEAPTICTCPFPCHIRVQTNLRKRSAAGCDDADKNRSITVRGRMHREKRCSPSRRSDGERQLVYSQK